jgi:signal transduction histidine kinase
MNPARLRSWTTAFAISVAGVVAAAGVAEAVGVPAKDTVTVLIESVVGAALAGFGAAALLVLLRRARVAVQAAVAALAPVAAVAIGVTWATSNMFITEHDLRILWVVLVAAGAAGMATALILAGRVAEGSRSVGEMARRLGEAGPVAMARADAGAGSGTARSRPRRSVPGELAALDAELRLTSSRLARAQLESEAIDRKRRELVAWVTHDLRTPLAGIRAMIEALEDGVVSDAPTVSRYHATIRLEADRLAGLVDDLFELSQIQSGTLSLALIPVALDEVLADAIEGAGVAARAKGVQLLCEVGDPCPVVEVATPEMIRVVRNLLDNAIRHTQADGRVTLTAGVDDGGSSVEVSVLDGCGGIPAEDLDRVFEMGYRGDVARTPGEGRGGLGLAVAQGLVQAHDGHISVSNEATGCRFTVRIPLHHLTQEPTAAG